MSKMMIASFSIVSAAGALVAARGWETEEKAWLLPGETSHGHYQIELSCESCHTPFGGVEQAACVGCHGEDLERSDDSHPVAKFSDPRNADRLEHLNALLCVTCHIEHRPERTAAMAVTQPADFCFHCHADIGEERESHLGLPFDGCASAGCHNFHDNRTLNTDYLIKSIDQPRLTAEPRLPRPRPPTGASDRRPVTAADADAPAAKLADPKHVSEWAGSAHARGGVSCSGCHGASASWIDRPTHLACKECHEDEVSGFLAGHHGMRLNASLEPQLSPMTPALARLPMRAEAAGHELGCQSCHRAHDYDRSQAAVEACLGCHADEHSLGYRESKHFALVLAERSGAAPAGSGVTCASCHLPVTRAGRIEHNQNDNLRPNEKMAAEVCGHCHGLGLTLDALADPALIRRGVRGEPAVHVDSLDMVRRHLAAKKGASDGR